MNKRIKELYGQAALVVFGYKVDAEGPNETLQNAINEKFAELIVRECIEEIEFQYNGGREINETTHSPDWNEAIECVSAMVRIHFGVEE